MHGKVNILLTCGVLCVVVKEVSGKLNMRFNERRCTTAMSRRKITLDHYNLGAYTSVYPEFRNRCS